MKPRIPNGGFLIAKIQDAHDLELRLRENGARTLTLPGRGLLLAAWAEYPGQGLWSNGEAAVAYDLDLTNEKALKDLVGLDQSNLDGPGHLLWELYQKYGPDFLDRLRGAFGFALWDGTAKRLLIATDPYGIRPVVYTCQPNRILAASRIRHILQESTISREIDLEAMFHFLFFSAICSPLTIYKGIRKLEPGNAILVDEDTLAHLTYYDIDYQEDSSRSQSHWMKTIPQEIEKAVGRYASLTPHEKSGCYLSGGTDSSSVAGFYTKVVGRPARTFSIGFDDARYNELNYAHIASKHFGTIQNDYFVKPADVLNLLEHLPEIFDEPFGNASVVPAYYCAALAKEKRVETLLGGDGGDEIFGGNERYVTNLVFERYKSLPRACREFLLEPFVSSLPQKGIIGKTSRYIRRANTPNPERFFSYNLLAEVNPNTIFQEGFLSECSPDCFMQLARNHYLRAAPAHDTNRLLYIDMKFTITDNDLRKVTVMAEAAGIRVRYPLLDRDLVDFSTTIPARYKVKQGKNRYIFKRAMEGFLPTEIIYKSKHGMGLPIAIWFRRDPALSTALADLLFSGKPRILEFIRPSFLEFLGSSFQKDQTSYYGDNLWVFLMLELWMQTR